MDHDYRVPIIVYNDLFVCVAWRILICDFSLPCVHTYVQNINTYVQNINTYVQNINTYVQNINASTGTPLVCAMAQFVRVAVWLNSQDAHT